MSPPALQSTGPRRGAQEQEGVLTRERGHGAPQLFFEQLRRLDAGGVRLIVVGRLGVNHAAAQKVDGRIDRCAPEVGRRPAADLVGVAPGHDPEEHRLQNVLGVSRIPGHAQGGAENHLVVPLVQLGKIGQLGRGYHLDVVVHLQPGDAHVTGLTYLDARNGRLLHGGGRIEERAARRSASPSPVSPDAAGPLWPGAAPAAASR